MNTAMQILLGLCGTGFRSPEDQAGGGGGVQSAPQPAQQPTQQPAQQPAQPQAPPQNPAPAPQPQGAQISADEYNQFMQWKQQQQQQPKPPTYEDHQNQLETQRKEREAQKNLESNIKFNMEFPGFFEANKAFFPENTSTLLTKAFNNETEKADSIRLFAAKDFFSNPKHIELLPENQRALANQLISNHSDGSFNPAQAWEMVTTAVYIANKQADADKTRNFYGKPNAGDLISPDSHKAFSDRIYGRTPIKE